MLVLGDLLERIADVHTMFIEAIAQGVRGMQRKSSGEVLFNVKQYWGGCVNDISYFYFPCGEKYKELNKVFGENPCTGLWALVFKKQLIEIKEALSKEDII